MMGGGRNEVKGGENKRGREPRKHCFSTNAFM